MVDFEESSGSTSGSPKGSLAAVPDDDLDWVHVSAQRKIPPNRVYLPKRVAEISLNGIHEYLVDLAPASINHLERVATPERDGSSTAQKRGDMSRMDVEPVVMGTDDIEEMSAQYIPPKGVIREPGMGVFRIRSQERRKKTKVMMGEKGAYIPPVLHSAPRFIVQIDHEGQKFNRLVDSEADLSVISAIDLKNERAKGRQLPPLHKWQGKTSWSKPAMQT
jgi:hypothetical protein